MFSRRLEDVFNKYPQVKMFFLVRLQDVFKTFSRLIQYVFETYSKDDYIHKDLPRPHFCEISGQGTTFPRVNTLDINSLLQNTS